MKKIFFTLFLSLIIALSATAQNMPDLKYKNIGNKDKIFYNPATNIWSKKADKNNTVSYMKIKGFGDFYDYLDSDKNFVFSTNCEYEFIYNNSFIGYSNRDLKFYDITYINGGLGKRELTREEVEEIFPEYKIVALSEFSDKTNSLKIKKHLKDLKIILYNDTQNTFDNFVFTSGNSKFEQYSLRGFLKVSSPGMIQFSRLGERDDNLWYVLLIR